jgi:hypothetical protein
VLYKDFPYEVGSTSYHSTSFLLLSLHLTQPGNRVAIEIRPRRAGELENQRSKACVRRTQSVSRTNETNTSIHTRRAVVRVTPKMAKVIFWLSRMKPARRETTFRVQIMVGDISRWRLERLIAHRGGHEGNSCPAIHYILGKEILRFV